MTKSASGRPTVSSFVLAPSNFLSRWSMLWVVRLMTRAIAHSPDSLIFALPPDQLAAECSQRLHAGLKRHPESLRGAIADAFGAPYALLGIWKLIWAFCTWAAAYYILQKMMEAPTHTLAALLLLFAVIASVSMQRLHAGSYTIRTKVRNALTAVVFQKSLVLSASNVNVGAIVNIVSTDVEAVSDCFSHLHFLWTGCIEVVAILVIAFVLAGMHSLISVVVIVLTVPVQLWIGYKISTASANWIAASGERLHLMTEMLTAMKLIKFYTWEQYFADKIVDVRRREADAALRQISLRAANFGLVMGAPVIATLSCLVAMQAAGERLDSITAFTLLSLFNTLRYPLFVMPMAVKSLASARNGLKSISTFLSLSQTIDSRLLRHEPSSNDAIAIRAADLAWDNCTKNTLSGVDVQLKKGQVLGVVGDVGTGKSSLLAAILGQMQIVKGDIEVNGRVSYCPQEAWLLNETVRDNITFGSPYNKERFDRVAHVCQLTTDLDNFDGGDAMLISERGANLSGGQRQRISLARAVYSDSAIVLLDDPLSALDQQVARRVFEECVKGFLSERAVVIVTHQLQYLPLCDMVATMGAGCVQELGTFDELLRMEGGSLRKLMTEHTDIDLDVVDKKEDRLADQLLLSDDNIDRTRRVSLREVTTTTVDSTTAVASTELKDIVEENQKTLNILSQINRHHTVTGCIMARKAELDHQSQCAPYFYHTHTDRASFAQTLQRNELLHLTSAEQPIIDGDPQSPVSTSSAKKKQRSPFQQYLRLGNGSTVVWFIVVLFFVVHGVRLASDIWVKVWQGKDDDPMRLALSYGPNIDAAIYAALGIVFTVGVLYRGFLLASRGSRRARQLHDDMASALFSAPMEFYDRTPLGSILQNSSKHQSDADDRLPDAALQFLMYLPLALGALAIIIWQSPNSIVLALFLVVVTVAGATVVALPKWSGIIQHCDQAETEAKPKLFSHIATSLEGLFSIRAFSAQPRFFADLLHHLDQVCIYQTGQQSTRCFVALYVDIICGVAVYCSAVLFVIYADGTSSATIGLALSNGLQLMVFVQWTLRMFEEVSTSMASVASLRSFGDGSVPSEAAPVVASARLDKDWPQAGLITFQDVVLRYTRYGVAVLKRVNFVVKPREKIGIVGRTGSGKSTLLIALLRIVESCAGRILIDGVDIAKIGLRELRRRITIIPQDPVIFGGSVRSNLDPYSEYADGDMLYALKAVELDGPIRQMGGLDAICIENGSNFSQGQKQLFCIARAILTKSKVIVLDEATAAIDAKTDAIVQRAFAENFAECTVLTIAHRLNTIIESDKILFMDQGRVAEFDRPAKLLSDADGAFAGLVAQTGPDSERKLRQIANQHAERRSSAVFHHADDDAFLDALARHAEPMD